MRPPDPDLHRLDTAVHEAIFQQRIVPRRLSRAIPWQRPTAYLLAGQPGAGKTQIKSAVVPFTLKAARDDRPRGGAIEIGSDKLRTFHPGYRELQRADDQTAASYTNADARLWVDEAVDYLVERRANVVLDSTLGKPDVAQSIIERFRDAGYRVEVAFVATPRALSLLGNLHRYQNQTHKKGFGRIVERANHDYAYTGVLETADRIDTGRLADAVHVYRRGGERIYTNHLGADGQWVRPTAMRLALETERSRVRTLEETIEIGAAINALDPPSYDFDPPRPSDEHTPPLTKEHQADLTEIKAMIQPILAPEVREYREPLYTNDRFRATLDAVSRRLDDLLQEIRPEQEAESSHEPTVSQTRNIEHDR